MLFVELTVPLLSFSTIRRYLETRQLLKTVVFAIQLVKLKKSVRHAHVKFLNFFFTAALRSPSHYDLVIIVILKLRPYRQIYGLQCVELQLCCFSVHSP